MKRTTRIMAGAVGIFALATLATAQPGPGPGNCPNGGPNMGPRTQRCMDGPDRPGRHGEGQRMLHRLRGLELTSEQWTQVREIQTNTEKQVVRKKADLRVLQIEKRELMHSESPSPNDIESKIRQISEVRADIQILHANAMLAVRRVLTEEQLEKFLDPSWRPDPPADAPGRRSGMMRNRNN